MVREAHWPPEVIGGLFVDAIDYQGVEFWYDDFKEMHAELNKK